MTEKPEMMETILETKAFLRNNIGTKYTIINFLKKFSIKQILSFFNRRKKAKKIELKKLRNRQFV